MANKHEQMKRDAARYRWLRERLTVYEVRDLDGVFCDDGEEYNVEVDAEIDRCMAVHNYILTAKGRELLDGGK